MFLRILGKSILKRKSRIAIAIISVLIGASVATALLTVSFDVSEKVSLEFRKYGANLLIVPHSDTIEVGFPGVEFGSITEQRYINESDIWKIKTIYWRNNVMGFAPFLYQIVTARSEIGEQRIVLAGTYFNRTIHIQSPYAPQDPTTFTTGVQIISPWWHIKGGWIYDQNDTSSCMIGAAVAEKLNLSVGDTFEITYNEQFGSTENTSVYNLTVVGIVMTDGYEDNQIFVNLQVAQEITGRPGKLHTIQISALCNACPVETFAEEIKELIPYVEGRSVKQLVHAEMDILGKIQNMMFLVTIVALIASALGVMTTMITSVIERQKEIGLMKSVGAENRKIIALFLSEATIIGVIGGIVGYFVGLILAQLIGISVFSLSITPRVEVIPIVIGISVGVALLASILPVRRAVRVEPAIVLRGE
jgi:putative ABC transport system permease protein